MCDICYNRGCSGNCWKVANATYIDISEMSRQYEKYGKYVPEGKTARQQLESSSWISEDARYEAHLQLMCTPKEYANIVKERRKKEAAEKKKAAEWTSVKKHGKHK